MITNTMKMIRKIVPSVAIIARTPVAPFLDVVDYFIRRGHPEWAELPPASLRMRIGVGNRILRNHQAYLQSASLIADELSARGYLGRDSSVLELGCGCGRNSIGFMRFLDETGSYAGLDVDRAMITWCQKNLQKGNTRFFHADIYSKVYNPGGKPSSDYVFPVNNASTSAVVSNSLFSHLLFPELSHYMGESSRVLMKGGYLHLTLFLMDFIRERLGDRWTFAHKIGNCYVETLRYPEAAVAYDLSVVQQVLSENGLTLVEVYNKEMHQQTLIARK